MMYNISDGTSSVDLLQTYLHDNPMKPSKIFTAAHIGATGIKNYPDQAITGFNADMLTQIMSKANLPNYQIQFYRHYTTPLLHLRTGHCDVAFGMFTHTMFRQHCDNNVSTSSGSVVACRPLPPTDDLVYSIPAEENPTYACCGAVGVPMFATTIGLLTTALSTPPTIATFLFQPEVANIVALVILAVVVAAHLVWLFERHENSDQFPTRYLDGIGKFVYFSIRGVHLVHTHS